MGTAAVHDDSFNGCLAVIAGKAGSSEDGDCILHIASCAIGFGVEVDAGTFPVYAQCEALFEWLHRERLIRSSVRESAVRRGWIRA